MKWHEKIAFKAACCSPVYFVFSLWLCSTQLVMWQGIVVLGKNQHANAWTWKKKEEWGSYHKVKKIKSFKSFSLLGISSYSLSLSFSYFHLFLFVAWISHWLFVSPGNDGESWVSICPSVLSSLHPHSLPLPLSRSLSPQDLGPSPPVRCPSLSLSHTHTHTHPSVSVQLLNGILSKNQMPEKTEMGHKSELSLVFLK